MMDTMNTIHNAIAMMNTTMRNGTSAEEGETAIEPAVSDCMGISWKRLPRDTEIGRACGRGGTLRGERARALCPIVQAANARRRHHIVRVEYERRGRPQAEPRAEVRRCERKKSPC